MIGTLKAKAAGLMASPLSVYLAVGALAAFLALFGLWRGAVADTAEAHQDIGRLASMVNQYAAALSGCQGAVMELQQAAELNKQAAARAEHRARQAEAAAISLRNAAATRIEGIRHDEAEMRSTTDETCRLLTDPLPDPFLAWVWDEPGPGDH